MSNLFCPKCCCTVGKHNSCKCTVAEEAAAISQVAEPGMFNGPQYSPSGYDLSEPLPEQSMEEYFESLRRIPQ